MVANDVSAADSGFEVDTNRAILLYSSGSREETPLLDKRELADLILDRVAAVLADDPTGAKREGEVSRFTFTSESVTEGHPDKMCDQISDAVLDGMFEQDPYSRVACESMCTTGMAVVAGEISSNAHLDIPRLVRDTIRGIGYTDASYGFDGNSCAVITSIDEQSSDIAQGVDKAYELRSGDGRRTTTRSARATRG